MGAAGIPRAVREEVLARAAGSCERCRAPRALELHHRVYRSRGGGHEVENLVALCGSGNASGCHGFAHSGPAAVRTGYSLPASVPAGLVPIQDVGGRWFALGSGQFPLAPAFALLLMSHLGLRS